MKPRISATIVFCMFAAAVAAAPKAGAYLKPDLKVGERLTDVYSKSTSIRGEGFEGHVSRYSGSADYAVTAVAPQKITVNEFDRSDGQPPAPHVAVTFPGDAVTNCHQGKCAVDDQTSGLLFNPYLWGSAPREVHAGSTWTVKIDNPWEIGPAGTETVRVLRIDPLNGEITLTRSGSGEGPSSDELRVQEMGKPVEITTRDGKQIEVSLIPGKATWNGYTTVCRGVIVGDELMVTQQVKLRAKDGTTFNGELRTYTLLDLAADTI